jgi:hypothetical protein
MPEVTFIGGFKDGEVSHMPSLNIRCEFYDIVRSDLPAWSPKDTERPLKIYAKTIRNEYRLEHLVSYEEKFWFYVEASIGPTEWVRKLVEGYRTQRGEG